MNGQRALIYSRIRENQLNPADSDITRGLRQQAVMRAVMAKLLGAGTVLHLPFNGDSLLNPLTTDLSAWQFMQLGWVLKRAGQKNAAALPARRDADVDRRRLSDRRQRGQPLGGADGHRTRGTSAAPAGLGSIRAWLRDRQPAVPLIYASAAFFFSVEVSGLSFLSPEPESDPDSEDDSFARSRLRPPRP